MIYTKSQVLLPQSDFRRSWRSSQGPSAAQGQELVSTRHHHPGVLLVGGSRQSTHGRTEQAAVLPYGASIYELPYIYVSLKTEPRCCWDIRSCLLCQHTATPIPDQNVGIASLHQQ